MRRYTMAAAMLAGVSAFALAPYAAHADAINLVQNGDFSQTSYTANQQFGTNDGGVNKPPTSNGGPQGVTGWTGNAGYNIWFKGGTSTTTSAVSQYGGGKEKLYAGPNGTPDALNPDNPAGGFANFVGLDGDQVDPEVQGMISQSITGLTAGDQYEVSFDWGAGQVQSRSGATTSSLTVGLGSTVVNDASFSGQSFSTGFEDNASESFSGWWHASFTFVANAASETLSFLSVGTPSGLPPMATLASVSMQKVPEPGSLALLGTALLGLGFFGYMRRRRS